MKQLCLTACAVIDVVTRHAGEAVRWLALAIPFVCVGHAAVRKLFGWGHNGISELQWYLFGAVYLVAGGYTLLRDAHVRVDVLWKRFGTRSRCVIDLLILAALVPICVYMARFYWSFWLVSLSQREGPEDVLTGLDRWPLKLALFIGISLLALQCAGEALKRLCVLLQWLPASTLQREWPMQSHGNHSNA